MMPRKKTPKPAHPTPPLPPRPTIGSVARFVIISGTPRPKFLTDMIVKQKKGA
jgi:hypothetical protein